MDAKWEDNEEGKTAKTVTTLMRKIEKVFQCPVSKKCREWERVQETRQESTFLLFKIYFVHRPGSFYSSKSLGLLEGSILEAHWLRPQAGVKSRSKKRNMLTNFREFKFETVFNKLWDNLNAKKFKTVCEQTKEVQKSFRQCCSSKFANVKILTNKRLHLKRTVDFLKKSSLYMRKKIRTFEKQKNSKLAHWSRPSIRNFFRILKIRIFSTRCFSC